MPEGLNQDIVNNPEFKATFELLRVNFNKKIVSFLEAFRNSDQDSPNYGHGDLYHDVSVFMKQQSPEMYKYSIPANVLCNWSRFGTLAKLSFLRNLIGTNDSRVGLDNLASYLSHDQYDSVFNERKYGHEEDELQEDLLFLFTLVYIKRPEVAVNFHEKLDQQKWKSEIERIKVYESIKDDTDELNTKLSEEIMSVTKKILDKYQDQYSKASLTMQLEQIVQDLKS